VREVHGREKVREVHGEDKAHAKIKERGTHAEIYMSRSPIQTFQGRVMG